MKYTEHGLLKHSKVGSLINFQSLNLHWSVLLDQIPLQLEREGIKEREDGERGGWGGGIVRGSHLLKYFHQRGAIIQGKWLIEGWLLFNDIQYIWLTHDLHHVNVYFMITGHLHDGVILLLRPESCGFFLSYANYRLCYLNLTGITTFKCEWKNEKNSGHSSKMTPSCKWPIVTVHLFFIELYR